MTRRRFRKHSPASRQVMAPRRRRAIGTTGAITAFLAFGVGQLADPPKAGAEGFDAVIDQALTAITGSSGDPDGVSGAASGLDGLGAGAADAGSAAAAGSAVGWLHTLEQDWADSALGKQVDTALGTLLHHFAPAAEATAVADAQSMSQNLLVNGDFSTADPNGSGYYGVTIPGWTLTGDPTVMEYGTLRGYPSTLSFPFPDLPKFLGFPQHAPLGTPAGDDHFAGGGPVATSSISQTVDLTGAAGTPFDLSADLGGQDLNPSYTSVQVSFLNADGDVLGTDSLKPVTVWDRLGFTGFEHRGITGTVPEGTTAAQVTTTFHDENHFLGNYNGAYAANESFTVGDPSLTAAPLTPPVSDVGHLDHVFVIYLENQGNGAILGNPNAPFINSLIKTEDFDSGYIMPGHPSNPNYTALMSGSDFDINYNNGTGTINAPNLMQEWDQAGISWAQYVQGAPPGGGSQDWATPFHQFSYISHNTPAYLQEHFFSQADLSSALQNPNTFPDFAWIKPNTVDYGNFNGPILSALRSIVTEIFPAQSVVLEQDEYLQHAVDTIESSPTWTDPNEMDAIFITYDEDNNEPSLGIENEGNNVPMIVIPNQGAVTEGGMQAHVTTDANYNVYSLMATIEDALRPLGGTLAPLTDNDKYAEPMNAFWK